MQKLPYKLAKVFPQQADIFIRTAQHKMKNTMEKVAEKIFRKKLK